MVELDAAAVQARVDEVSAASYKMAKARPLDGVVKALATELAAFKETLPLLQEVLILGLPSGCHWTAPT